MHIVFNISKNKDNQTMKFGHLLEYGKRHIFLEKFYTKCGKETIPRPFTKNKKLSISFDQHFKLLYSLFYCLQS